MRKRLIQEQKEQERKGRTNRLCKRRGLIEKLLPGTIPLAEEQFKTFLEQTIATKHRRLLDGLTAQNVATTPAQGAETSARGNALPTATTAHTAQERGARVKGFCRGVSAGTGNFFKRWVNSWKLSPECGTVNKDPLQNKERFL